MENKIDYIIARVLAGEASQEDINLFKEWLNNDESHLSEYHTLESYWNANIISNQTSFTQKDIEENADKFLSKINHKSEIKKLWVRISFVASFLIIGTSLALFLFYENISDPLVMAAKTLVPAKSNNIELVLSFDKRIPISESNAIIQYAPKGDITINSQTICDSKKENKKLQYNQLIVPIGKRTFLTLADSTRIWVNAGTRIIYPEVFDKNKREIYVEGEIYLDVYHDEKRPFIVKTSDMQVSVLGTSFNVRSYKNDTIHSVVLVSGSVKVKSNKEKSQTLHPNEMYYKTGETTNIETVETYDFISWKDGIYLFDQEKIEVILGRLSKYYGISVTIDPSIRSITYSGKLNLAEDVNKLLDGLTITAPICYQQTTDGTYYFTLKNNAYGINNR